MEQTKKTNQQLVDEIAKLHRKIEELEKLETEHGKTETLLRESEKKYHTLIESTFDFVFTVDRRGLFTYHNARFEMVTGFAASELIGRPFTDVVAHEARKTAAMHFKRGLKGEKGSSYEIDMIHKSGSRIPVEFNVATLFDGNGQPIGRYGIGREITERKEAESALKKSEDRLYSIIQNLTIPTFVIDKDHNIIYWNQALEELSHIKAVDVIGTREHWRAFYDKERPCMADLLLDQRLDDIRRWYAGTYQKSKLLDAAYEATDFFPSLGQKGRWLRFTATTIKDSQENIVGAIETLEDVSDRKFAEEALNKSEREKSAILDAMSEHVILLDTDLRIVWSNRAINQQFNLKPGEAEGRYCYESLHGISRPCRICPAIKAIKSGRSCIVEDFSSLGKRWILRASPIRDEGGDIVGVVEIGTDITERKRAEEALQESEEKYRSLASTEDSMYLVDRACRYLFMNEGHVERFGLPLGDVIGRTYSEFHSEEDSMIFAEKVEEVFTKGRSIQDERMSERDGHYFLRTFSPLRGVGGDGTIKGVTVVSKDITDRKRAEGELVKFSEEISDLYHNAPCGYHSLGPDGMFLRINDTALQWLGYSREEVVGKKHWTDLLTPEGVKVFHKTFHVFKKRGCINNLEFDMIRKDGTTLPVLLSATAIKDKDFNFIMSRSILFDITDRRKLEYQLMQAQKLESIGTLAGGIAHDFNNLLMGIQGYASLMLLNLDKSHPHYDRLRVIEEHVQRGAHLTKQLLGFARGGRFEIKPTDMNETIHNTSTMFNRTKKEITIHCKFDKGLWTTEVDQGQIEQVLLNLYVNAWQAMPGGGEIYLETQNVDLDERYTKAFFVSPGRYVKISITDTGVGMDKKTKERIFEPFFTTKEMGRGTGLGLATVYGIIKGHKGFINVYSEKGHGTTFNIYLPASEKEVTGKMESPQELMKGKETILVVDDEDHVLDVTKELLESLGYLIITTKSGEEAVKVYKDNKRMIDLVILDMVMPGMNGGEAFGLLKGINPDVKVILSSGYSLNGHAMSILDMGCRAFLQKPFTLKGLSLKVRSVLDNK